MLNFTKTQIETVLIPLLVDDPLWGVVYTTNGVHIRGLNPSFSG